MGGETSSGGSYIVESAPLHRRGFSGSFFYISVGLGTLCASLTGTFLTFCCRRSRWKVTAGGWCSCWARCLASSASICGARSESRKFSSAPLKPRQRKIGQPARRHAQPLAGRVACLFLAIGTTMAFYIWAAYIPNLLRASGRISASTSFLASTFGLIAYSVSMPISGALADRVGRRLVLGSSWLLFAALFIPMIHYALGNPELLPWIMVAAMSLIGMGSGAVAASFAEQFPTSVRAIGWGCPTTFPLPCLAAPRRILAPGSPVEECPTCSIGMSWRFAS